MSSFENEAELIERMRANDSTAMTAFYQQYRPLLYPVILRIVRGIPSAEDVLQESMLKIWGAFDSYDASRGRLLSWALQICKNKAIDHVRDRRYQQAQRTFNIESAGTSQEAPTTFQPEYVGVREYTHQLRPEYRRLIELLYFEGLTQAEAAERLQMPLGTVKTHSRRAMEELIQIFR